MTNTGGTPAGWYHAPGDAEGTQRYWDGSQWIGEPQTVQQQSAATSPVDDDATVRYTPPAASTPPPSYQAPSAPAPSGFGSEGFGSAPSPSYGAPGGAPQYGQPAGSPPPGYVPFGTQQGIGAHQLGEPWKRIVARIIDGLIWGVVAIVLAGIVGVGVVSTGNVGEDTSFGLVVIAGLVSAALVVAYEVLMTTMTGSTLGKKVFGLRIVREDGSAPDVKTMMMRMSTYIAAAVIGLIPILGVLASIANLLIAVVSLIFLFTDSKRQTIWDKIGKTIVVE
jgi:uncharacterized RDD family membrane protein YckC